MNNDYKDSKFKRWLDKLQQESWELELLISGFAIFGLITAYEPLSLSIKVADNEGHTFQLIISIIAIIASSILIFNLLLHIILRGLWIGTLGLRYVFGDIDYEELKYSEKFTSYLKNKIGSFDKYIAEKRYARICAMIAISGEVEFTDKDPNAGGLLGEKFTESTMNPGLKGRDMRKAFDSDDYQVMIAAEIGRASCRERV